MKKFYDATPPYIVADEGMVLCDGNSYGKRIYSADTATLDAYQEMTEEEAIAMLPDPDAEATEEDYISALNELGVNTDEA